MNLDPRVLAEFRTAVTAAPLFAAHQAVSKYVQLDEQHIEAPVDSFDPSSVERLSDEEVALLHSHDVQAGHCGLRIEQNTAGLMLGGQILSLLRIETPAIPIQEINTENAQRDHAAWNSETRQLYLEFQDDATEKLRQLVVFIEPAEQPVAAYVDDVEQVTKTFKEDFGFESALTVAQLRVIQEIYGDDLLPLRRLDNSDLTRLVDALEDSWPVVIDSSNVTRYLL